MNTPEISEAPPRRPLRIRFRWFGLYGQRRWLIPRRPEGDEVRRRH